MDSKCLLQFSQKLSFLQRGQMGETTIESNTILD